MSPTCAKRDGLLDLGGAACLQLPLVGVAYVLAHLRPVPLLHLRPNTLGHLAGLAPAAAAAAEFTSYEEGLSVVGRTTSSSQQAGGPSLRCCYCCC